MTTWMTSDWHLSHRNIITHCARPFHSVEEMNAALVSNFNATVGPEDIVYHLGDFSLDERKVQPYLEQLVGKEHHLVAGNHDACFPTHKKCKKDGIQRYLDHGFTSVTIEPIEVEGFILAHLPCIGDHDDEHQRLPEYRPKFDHTKVLLCGHVHEKWRDKRAVKDGRRMLQINVGVDQWGFKPITLDDITTHIQLGREMNE